MAKNCTAYPKGKLQSCCEFNYLRDGCDESSGFYIHRSCQEFGYLDLYCNERVEIDVGGNGLL